MKELLGLAAVLLSCTGFVLYVRSILRHKTKPHLFTYIIWLIVTALAFSGQWVSGAGPGAWTTGLSVIFTLVVLLLAFKYGTNDVTKLDVFFFITALLAIIPWWLTHDPTLSVVLATLIDVSAFLPTVRKTYNDPSSEPLVPWSLTVFLNGLAIAALSTFTITTYIYPAAMLCMNALVVAVIVGRRKG